MATLLHRLGDPEPEVRLAALLEAGALTDLEGQGAVLEAMVQRLWDEHPGIRQASLDMLGRLATFAGHVADERAVARALALARDESAKVRAEAAAALALLGTPGPDPERVQALLHLAEDEVPEVRHEALAALGDLEAHAAREVLARHLDDPDAEAAFEAAFALASLKDPRGRVRLERELPRARRRLDACEGLRRLGDPAAEPALRGVLGRWFLPWADRLSVWAALYAVGASDAADQLLASTRARRREERTHALALLGMLRVEAGRARLEAVARDPQDPLRDTAVRALGELGAQASAAVLQAILHAPDTPPELAEDVRAALGGGPRSA